MHHGVGGGKVRGSKTTNLQRLFNIWPGADLYMEGHTHTYDHFIDKVQYIDRKRGIVSEYQATFVTTAHFMSWRESYGEDKKFTPSQEGSAFVTLKHAGAGNFGNKRIKSDLFY